MHAQEAPGLLNGRVNAFIQEWAACYARMFVVYMALG
jgi:hypothetical protein